MREEKERRKTCQGREYALEDRGRKQGVRGKGEQENWEKRKLHERKKKEKVSETWWEEYVELTEGGKEWKWTDEKWKLAKKKRKKKQKKTMKAGYDEKKGIKRDTKIINGAWRWNK